MSKQTIAQIGLKKYLNSTKARHRGMGYDTFLAMIAGNASKSSMARTFNVRFDTMDKWLLLHKIEKAKHAKGS